MGEIYRLGLLKNHLGRPYKNKVTVLRIVKSLPHDRVQTPWGMGYAVSQRALDMHNSRWK